MIHANSFNIENNKKRFDEKILSSLKYISESLKTPFRIDAEIHFNWQVYANYFLCLDAIKENNEDNARKYHCFALNALTFDRAQKNDNIHHPEITFITSNNINSSLSLTLKDIYDKPDNDVNDDGVYAFGPFTGDTGCELLRIQQAIEILHSTSPYYYSFVISLIKHIVLVGQTARGGIKSGSTLKTLGCIIISPNTKEEFCPTGQYIEDLIHEASHNYLFLEQAIDPLVNNPVVNLYEAPFRKDKRPMSGIYHANYVLGNIVSYFSQAVKATSNDKKTCNTQFLNRALNRYKETSSIIELHGDLTVRGRDIFDEMKTQVTKCIN